MALPATFTGTYRQRTQEDSLDRHPFNRVPVIGIDFASRVRQDSLRSYQLADTLIRTGNELLINYFQALTALSSTNSTFVPVRLKSSTFDAFLQNSALKLSAEQTASFNRVANVLGAAATGAYRRRKIANLIERSHNDVRQVLGVMAFANERLAQVVAISLDQQYGYYKNGLIQDPTLTYSQKRESAQQWLKTAKANEQTRQAILTYVKALKTLQAGHDELYTQRNKLTTKAALSGIGAYLPILQQLRSDLEQLKPVYGRLNP
ncbi:hypothetical protein ACFSUS_15865 [Spirosoma soli]|uniref:TolC family protein n=1 Tax=Spirosoma soli TaxID=1770529 RepID=A0ABW5M7Q8_9BACT